MQVRVTAGRLRERRTGRMLSKQRAAAAKGERSGAGKSADAGTDGATPDAQQAAAAAPARRALPLPTLETATRCGQAASTCLNLPLLSSRASPPCTASRGVCRCRLRRLTRCQRACEP